MNEGYYAAVFWLPPNPICHLNLRVKIFMSRYFQGIVNVRESIGLGRLSLVGDLRKVSVQDAKFQKLSAWLSGATSAIMAAVFAVGRRNTGPPKP